MENCMKFGQLIFSKIIKIVATSCQILRLKCTKFAHSAPPDPLAGFKGAYILLRVGEGRQGKERGGGKVREEGERGGDYCLGRLSA